MAISFTGMLGLTWVLANAQQLRGLFDGGEVEVISGDLAFVTADESLGVSSSYDSSMIMIYCVEVTYELVCVLYCYR